MIQTLTNIVHCNIFISNETIFITNNKAQPFMSCAFKSCPEINLLYINHNY